MRLIVRMLMLVFVLVPMAVHAQTDGATLQGWNAVRNAIAQQPADNMDALNGRQFSVTLSPNASGLEVSPAEVFRVDGSGPNYTVTIVDGDALVVNEGGLLAKRPTRWDARIGSGDIYDLSIKGADECVFNLTFAQVNGPPLNLTNMTNTYDVDWRFNRPAAVQSAAINGSSLRVTRQPGNIETLEVTLRLVNKTNGRVVESPPVPIQVCASDVRDESGDVGIIQVRTPSQCINRTRSKEDSWSNTEFTGVDYETIYANNCDRPIRCELTWRMFRYNSRADGIARVNGTETATYGIQMEIQPYSSVPHNFYIRTREINYAYYSWSSLWLPDQAAPGFRERDFTCSWVS